jgi:hypothetical protein
MRQIISGGALCSDIKRALGDKTLTDQEKLERIELATDLYQQWNKEGVKKCGS